MLIEDLLADESRLAEPPGGDRVFSGSAGGAPCGDLLRLSIEVDGGVIVRSTRAAEGCAVSRAASAVVAEAIETGTVLEAATIDEAAVSSMLGGLSPTHLHAAELAVDSLSRALGAAAGSGIQLDREREGSDRVLVALSGGVDSAVAALLAQRAGHDVVAVTLKLWQDPANDGERSCCSPEAVLRARRLAHAMKIPHFTLDLTDDFAERVVGDFTSGYAAGRTPNPCVRCNGEVRIDAMIDLADRLGASRLITGHYASIAGDREGPLLARPDDLAKDQTHMLAALAPDSLARLEFPLARLAKAEVRAIAAEAELPVASQPESQDLCFLAGEGKLGFLRRHAGLEDSQGDVVDGNGRVLGSHRGFHRYTVGQRRGLGIGGGEPKYVIATDPETNTVVVGDREELEAGRIVVSSLKLWRDPSAVEAVRLRSHQEPISCRVVALTENGSATLDLDAPALGVAAGQSVTLYSEKSVVGQAVLEGGIGMAGRELESVGHVG